VARDVPARRDVAHTTTEITQVELLLPARGAGDGCCGRVGAGMLCGVTGAAPQPPPWRVFLSHTSELAELPADRSFVAAAKDAVADTGHAVVDMSSFTADPQPPAEVCRSAVHACDVYVLIAGFRYGSPVRDEPEVSYTELEFEEAAAAGKRVLVFLLGERTVGPPALFRDLEHGPRQEQFRRRALGCGVTAARVSSPEELAEKLSRALGHLARNPSSAGSAGSSTAVVGPVIMVPPLQGEEVARPDLLAALVEAVLTPGAGSVGVTTGLWGAGGFGKTTLARMVAHDPRVRREFTDGVVWVSVGEDTIGPDLAAAVTSAVRLFDRGAPEVTDPLAAGAGLGRVLDGRRVLVVVDDVWTSAQVEPFLLGGDRVVRLFTTRIRGVLPGSTVPVRVDQMAAVEARELLTAGLPALPKELVEATLGATGLWPVLLSLVHGAVRDAVTTGGDATDELHAVLRALRTDGVTVLDVDDPAERNRAVARTIEVSLARLTAEQRDRYRELAVFGEDVSIPGEVLASYWSHTGGWSPFRTRQFCQRLFDLALLAEYHRDSDRDRLGLHDVIRAYLCGHTMCRHGQLDAAMVDAHRDLVPQCGSGSVWAELPAEQMYLWSWLPTHLWRAGLVDELEVCLTDPGWLIGKLELVGPAGLEADLALSDEPTCRAAATTVRQNAHVLGRLDPPESLAATVASRLPDSGVTADLRERVLGALTGPHLRAVTPPPDLPHPALNRVLTGHTDPVVALAVAPDGRWLASAGGDGTVRIWDPVTGTAGHLLTGHTDPVVALAVAPDGRWLASAGGDGTVRIWDPATGEAIASIRVAYALRQVLAIPTGIVAAGERGPYFLTLCRA